MSTGRSTDASFSLLRPGFAERCFVLCAPAALAAGFGSIASPAGAAAAGAVGVGLGLLHVALAERRAALAAEVVEHERERLAEAARAELRGQLVELVGEAARTGVEFERRAAFAEDARRAQNQLLAELAPEFYGLLRAMGHHADKLREYELDSEGSQAVDGLVDGASSLRRLLGAVLDLARARAGRLRLRERDFDLAAALTRIGRAFDAAARAKGVSFQPTIGRLANHWRFGDERRLQQLLERVLGAALDTTERGAIELSVAEVPERPDRLRFEIRDGAPVHDQASFERILTESPGGFENLFELDASLSLALARGLAEVLGGRLEAAARAEGGHVIAVELPLPHGADPDAEQPALPGVGVGLRAVVAAPAGADGDLAESIATGLGWIVQRCRDAAEASEVLTEGGGSDVLIVATSFDAGRGLERLRAWHAQWPRAASVVLLDGATAVDPGLLAASGARRAVACPPAPAALRTTLAELVLSDAGAPRPSSRVLLACSDELSARVHTRRLEAAGHVVDRVASVDAAVDAFQDAVYGLVLVDAGGDADVLADVARRLAPAERMSAGAVKIRDLAGGNSGAPSVPARPDTCPSVGSSEEVRSTSPGNHPVTDSNPRVSIDLDVIQSLKELGGDDEPSLLAELIELFTSDTPQRLARMLAAVESGDFDEAGRIAHALKSSCGNLGAVAMADLCRTIEHSCREGSVDDVPSLVQASRSEYERVARALAQQIG
jgi:signal transduction histidine kinase/HPt (histidine-containing phosphotransfer) domain-containing protein/CheY-like chemotaxis protein